MARLTLSLLILSVVNFTTIRSMGQKAESQPAKLLSENLAIETAYEITFPGKLAFSEPQALKFTDSTIPTYLILEKLIKTDLLYSITLGPLMTINAFYLFTYISAQSKYIPSHIWHLVLIWNTLKNKLRLRIDETALDEFLQHIAEWNVDKIKRCINLACIIAQSQQAVAIETAHLHLACSFIR